ncbi:MAG TPA: hypothetical protein VGN15_10560, partial [Ktedonobacteraceae bacterium]|nr:hypothetical protein [Ktedonobacteraceae bacterium]
YSTRQEYPSFIPAYTIIGTMLKKFSPLDSTLATSYTSNRYQPSGDLLASSLILSSLLTPSFIGAILSCHYHHFYAG